MDSKILHLAESYTFYVSVLLKVFDIVLVSYYLNWFFKIHSNKSGIIVHLRFFNLHKSFFPRILGIKRWKTFERCNVSLCFSTFIKFIYLGTITSENHHMLFSIKFNLIHLMRNSAKALFCLLHFQGKKTIKLPHGKYMISTVVNYDFFFVTCYAY